ncbi:RNA-directed DNA polymerase from mobile element jockey [Trichonephila clavipes]|nr:RNA-directed DNA polymerase from mobile element jockey [Trichonephila clavipes]
MFRKSPFAIQKALKGIGEDSKSVKKLRFRDLLIETVSALQTKYFLLAKIFLDCPLIATPHKSLNSYRCAIHEPDQLCASEVKIFEGLSDQGVTQLKCVNCSQYQPSDSKFCPKWKVEKQIQEIKTTKNISYLEARKSIIPQLSQTYT